MVYTRKRCLVVGLGISGRSAAYFLLKQQALVTGIDKNHSLLNENEEIIQLKQIGLKTYSEEEELNLKNVDLVVLSPGIPCSHPIYIKAQKLGIEVIGEIELGCRSLSNPVIGVTGTNGKTTVTLLITHLLNQNGYSARALGNVGVPLTKEIEQLNQKDIIILELSSFQLETFRQQVLDAAVVLNITPDHLDRYPSMQAYAEAKLCIENCLKETGKLYVEQAAFKAFPNCLKRKKHFLYGYSPDCTVYTDLKHVFFQGNKEFDLPNNLKGIPNHNLENAMAAYAICKDFGITPDGFLNALKTFKKPSHRIEFVVKKNGVTYYDDSKGTNVDAVMRAVQSIPGRIILIAGGVHKGSTYSPWIESFANRVRCICAIGQAAGTIEQQLSAEIPVKLCLTLEQAVHQAASLANEGDTVLLSPGCSSYDMFRDYKHRGEEFQRIVGQL